MNGPKKTALKQWLSETRSHPVYWARVRTQALELGANGCSGVPEFYAEACLEHDIHYRTGKLVDGGYLLLRAEADWIFRCRIQQRSWFCLFSPMAWWRWLGVRWFGGASWKGVGD